MSNSLLDEKTSGSNAPAQCSQLFFIIQFLDLDECLTATADNFRDIRDEVLLTN